MISSIDRYTVECDFTYNDLLLMKESLQDFGDAIRDAVPNDYEEMHEYEADQEKGLRCLALAVRINRLLEPLH